MEETKQRVENLVKKLDVEGKKKRIAEIEAESLFPDFWKDHQAAAEKMKEMSSLQKLLDDVQSLEKYVQSGELDDAIELLDTLETFLYFSGPFDSGSAILAIHSGQGGVEAMDWAQMLFRMYTRYFERKGWKYEIIDQTPGEEAGFKSITVSVDGDSAFGLLKGEAGVHRLVRQSPFNADKLRQTSFALVEVLPQVDDNNAIEIKDDDLDWEFYRASSHGGQNVQKVSSAVRLKHKPTGIVVTAQSERYQNQNREYALKLLRSKLWVIKEEERKKEEAKMKGVYKTPGWGNQIRSYVLHPYHMVKDLRTDVETSNTEKILDGDLDEFIDAELRFFA